MHRHYSLSDKLFLTLDQAIRALYHNPKTTGKSYPAQNVVGQTLTEKQRKHSAGLMRVNHAGEICAQALYHGQAAITSTSSVKEKMQQAAIEEGDHLIWCEKRLHELNSYTSYLNPLWYIGSFGIGMLASVVGDHWNLGFVAETEHQVISHLKKHLALLPEQDQRSYIILQQMEKDEMKHREEAIASGANELPSLIRKAMALVSNIMVKTTYWI